LLANQRKLSGIRLTVELLVLTSVAQAGHLCFTGVDIYILAMVHEDQEQYLKRKIYEL
jgi:hypothetical protein